MTNNNQINLCQPNNQKGCSACCGLFNLSDISKKNLSQYLDSGHKRVEKYLNNFNLHRTDGVRDVTSYICPYQGYIDRNKPGCIIHPLISRKDLRDYSLFGEKICGSFLCPAHSLLNNDQKKILINCIDDWYYYTIAIIDPESYIWIFELIQNELKIDAPNLGTVLLNSLKIHTRYLQLYKGPIFFYSISEYNNEKEKFSLLSGNQLSHERDEIYNSITKKAIYSFIPSK